MIKIGMQMNTALPKAKKLMSTSMRVFGRRAIIRDYKLTAMIIDLEHS